MQYATNALSIKTCVPLYDAVKMHDVLSMLTYIRHGPVQEFCQMEERKVTATEYPRFFITFDEIPMISH